MNNIEPADNTAPATSLRQFDIVSNDGDFIQSVWAHDVTDAVRRSDYTYPYVHAVPRSRHAATQPQPLPYVAPSPQPVSPVQQVVSLSQPESRRRCPHLLHFVLTILTAGLWLPVWIIDALISGRNR